MVSVLVSTVYTHTLITYSDRTAMVAIYGRAVQFSGRTDQHMGLRWNPGVTTHRSNRLDELFHGMRTAKSAVNTGTRNSAKRQKWTLSIR